ncbi:cyclohexanone monooxygenase [Hyaloraphidium curvatum]|nr:cyclohexanone monooxygenase [Hyaloraphidium curvatum]
MTVADKDEVLDVLVVGSGFAGMYMCNRLRADGKTVRSFERSDEAGGTWNWNRYPGARVDVPSSDYSYKCDSGLYSDWEWSEKYAPQPELMSYIKHVFGRWKLEPVVQFETTVKAAKWDDAAKRWSLEVEHHPKGGAKESQTWKGRHLVLATGCLSAPQMPRFPGLDEFKGESYHTGLWPREGVDFTGKRVAVIGTGSSAVQSIPVIAAQADQVTVFQRTPTYSVPANNAKLTPEQLASQKQRYDEIKALSQLQGFGAGTFPNPTNMFADTPAEERDKILDAGWEEGGAGIMFAWADVITNPVCNDYVKDWFHRKIKSMVKDQETAQLLCPDYPVACKRLCVDTDYYITYNRPNVKLISIKVRPITYAGGKEGVVRLEDGSEFGPFDAIVTAIGFDAMTGSLDKISITGRDGLTLKKAWEAGPATYLGLLIHGFPNMYHIAGPGSPSVLTNMMTSIEQHVEWIADTIKDLDSKGISTIEATLDAQDAWVGHVNTVAGYSVYPTCNSWYLGANIPGKVRVFMPLLGYPPYAAKCREVREKGYEGCVLGK